MTKHVDQPIDLIYKVRLRLRIPNGSNENREQNKMTRNVAEPPCTLALEQIEARVFGNRRAGYSRHEKKHPSADRHGNGLELYTHMPFLVLFCSSHVVRKCSKAQNGRAQETHLANVTSFGYLFIFAVEERAWCLDTSSKCITLTP